MLGLGQWVEHCNLTMLGVKVLSHMASGYCSLVSLSLTSLSLPPLSLSPSLTTQCLAFVTSIYLVEEGDEVLEKVVVS